MPQTLSPFRYPGGKDQLYPFVRNILQLNNIHGTYVETFAGGSALGLRLLFNEEIDKIVINDLDSSIFSVWNAILCSPHYLVAKINSVPFDYYNAGVDSINLEYWKKQRRIYFQEKKNPYSLEGAFATLFLNRTTRSGIITGGPIGGWGQRKVKIGARFNKSTLTKKIFDIYRRREHITLLQQDALDLIPNIPILYDPNETFIFFDPPYYEQGSSLYYSALNDSDHNRLSKEIIALSDFYWIVTYDHNPSVLNFYEQLDQKFDYNLSYSANNRGRASEYMFASSRTKVASFKKIMLRDL